MGAGVEAVTLRFERDGRELWRSFAPGIRPLVEAILTLGEELRGARAYDKVVGLASAKLLLYANVVEVRLLRVRMERTWPACLPSALRSRQGWR